MDFEVLRKRMVNQQLIPRGISDKRIIEVFLKIERHKFIPEDIGINAYADFPIPIGEGQTISQPYIVALMTECLELNGEEKVLEIGTGSGYQTAILAELAKEIYSVERHEKLTKRAETLLQELGYHNIKIRVGDGTRGWEDEAPFDRIIVTAASPQIPQPLLDQLRENGRLILPLGTNFGQMLTLIKKTIDGFESTNICGCVFVPLIGQYGYRKD